MHFSWLHTCCAFFCKLQNPIGDVALYSYTEHIFRAHLALIQIDNLKVPEHYQVAIVLTFTMDRTAGKFLDWNEIQRLLRFSCFRFFGQIPNKMSSETFWISLSAKIQTKLSKVKTKTVKVVNKRK